MASSSKATVVAVLAGVALGLAVVVLPPGAAAFCPPGTIGPDCHPIPEIPFDPPADYDGPGGGGDGGGGQAPTNTEAVKRVAQMARNALKDDKCNNFISGGQTGANDARTRFETNTIMERPNDLSPKDASAPASINAADLGRGGGVITLWQPYFSDTEIEKLREQGKTDNVFRRAVERWTPDQLRALVMLHEQAHLSGTLPADHKGSWGGNPSPQVRFHAAVTFHCRPRL
jgi:hypothetical protein